MITFRARRTGAVRSTWIVAVLIGLLVVLPSCSLAGTQAPAAVSEGHLRLAGSTFGLQTLDPALVRDVDTAFVARQIFRGLMRLNNNLEAVPDLAESVAVLDEGLRYRFVLRDGLTFHNGAPIDAAAVVLSMNRAADPSLGADLPAATYLGDIAGIDERLRAEADRIEGITAIDPRTIEIRLKHPVATFPLKMTGLPAAVVDVGTISGEDWWHEANGSGPFRLAEYVAGSRVVMTAFDGYAGGSPELETVTILLGRDALQPLNLYESGAIDVTAVPGWALDRVQTESDPFNAQLVEMRQMSTTFLAFNPTIPPFDDPDVRLMIASGFDVSRFIDLALDDRGEQADGLIPPGVAGREWKSTTVDYSLAAARALHQGIDGDLTQAMVVEPGGGIATSISSVLMRDIGFDLTVLDQPWPDFAQRLPEKSLPAFILTWVADYPDPENTLATLLRTGSSDNYLAHSNAEFDALVSRAQREPDDEVRAQLYLAAQQLVLDDAIVVPLYHGMSYTLVQPWVHGLEITEIGILGLEDVWIESESS